MQVTNEILISAQHHAEELESIIEAELGSPILTPALPHVPASSTSLDSRPGSPYRVNGGIVPVAANFKDLTLLHGRGLLMVPYRPSSPSRFGYYTGVITPLSVTYRSIQLTWLSGDPVPVEDEVKISNIEQTLLLGSMVLQNTDEENDPERLKSESPGARVSHVALALRALSSPNVANDIQSGANPIYRWAETDAGIVPHLASRKGNLPGMFDFESRQSTCRISISGMRISPQNANMAFVDPVALKTAPRSKHFKQAIVDDRQSAIERLVLSRGVVEAHKALKPILKNEKPSEAVQSTLDNAARLMLGLGWFAAKQRNGSDSKKSLVRSLNQVNENAIKQAAANSK